jgi:hypothetical protein
MKSNYESARILCMRGLDLEPPETDEMVKDAARLIRFLKSPVIGLMSLHAYRLKLLTNVYSRDYPPRYDKAEEALVFKMVAPRAIYRWYGCLLSSGIAMTMDVVESSRQ